MSVVLFYSASEPFSQFYPCKFAATSTVWPGDDVHEYWCAELWMMAEKARLFNDRSTLALMWTARKQADIKALGRRVHGFDELVWAKNRYRIVLAGNMHKFRQNPRLCKRLLATGSSRIAEASPSDTVWGIGLSAQDVRAKDPKKWRGQNLLGKVLEDVRTQLARETANKKSAD